MKPKRIQRKRTKGWKMPPNTIIITRPGKWGNPLKLVGDCIYIDAGYRRTYSPWVFYNVGDIDDLIYLYGKLWDGTEFYNKDLQHWADEFKKLDLSELKGKNLTCFCKAGEQCHGDVLLELANK